VPLPPAAGDEFDMIDVHDAAPIGPSEAAVDLLATAFCVELSGACHNGFRSVGPAACVRRLRVRRCILPPGALVADMIGHVVETTNPRRQFGVCCADVLGIHKFNLPRGLATPRIRAAAVRHVIRCTVTTKPAGEARRVFFIACVTGDRSTDLSVSPCRQ
jgi:hypothetical protein